MGSTRLPGKTLAMVGELPLIEHVIRRANAIKGVSQVILAIPDSENPVDLLGILTRNSAQLFKGHPTDVAKRALDCAKHCNADYFFRINGDSPCIDPDQMTDAVAIAKKSPNLDFVTNIPGRTFPYGVSVELIKTETLRKAYPNFSDSQKEHVTAYFYDHLDKLQSHQITSDHLSLSKARLVVDTPQDLSRIDSLLTGSHPEDIPYENIASAYLKKFSEE